MNKIQLIILNQLENARLVGLCAKEIAAQSFDEAALMEIELATVEIVNNCIEHAYSGSDNQQISIEFWLNADLLLIEIMDTGKSMDLKLLDNLGSDFNFDHTDMENIPEGGMGLKIVKNCMDEMSYQNQNGKNYWSLTKYP